MRSTWLMARWLLAALAASALLAACGGDADDGGEASSVRPFAEVQAGELVFENDATFPGRGIFRVTTTEAMICAIVWGESEALGRFHTRST